MSATLIQLLTAFGDIFEFALPVGIGLHALKRGHVDEMCSLGLFAGIQQAALFSLKALVASPRPFPYQFNLDSFPSGHTAGAFLAVGFLFTIDTLSKKTGSSPYVPRACKLAIFFAAILVGISRYLALKHWPIDVFAGACLGTFFGACAAFVPSFLRRRKLLT